MTLSGRRRACGIRAAGSRAVGADDALGARARGWTLWKALVTLVDDPKASSHVIDAALTG